MEQTLELIENINRVVLFILCSTIFWEIKSKLSMPCIVTHMGLTIVLFALQIPRLVLKVLLNQSYGEVILLLCIWTHLIAMDSFLIGNKKGKNLSDIERILEDCEETSDNQ